MTTHFNPNLYRGTPTIKVVDNRGLAVRKLQYNRTSEQETVKEGISRSEYNAEGHVINHIDPRLYHAQLTQLSIKPNFTYQSDLVGNALYTDSVDAGCQMILKDIEGRPVWKREARGTEQRWQYETGKNGRLLAVSEQPVGGTAYRVIERFIYAPVNEENKKYNLSGRLLHHYNTAGVNTLRSVALTGQPLREACQLLRNIDQPLDWRGEDQTTWNTLLAEETFTTRNRYNAAGKPITHIDAKGNQQGLVYDVAGQLQASRLTIHNQPEQRIVDSLTYSAAGQKLCEISGNGVKTEYRYDPQNLRLINSKTTRQSDRKILQDLHYQHDPVGNILSIEDHAINRRFYKNQEIKAQSRYSYDALYQLSTATGRESYGQRNPQVVTPPPLIGDQNHTVNYSREYTYDSGGNLIQIQHHGANRYTTHINVSQQSNHALFQDGDERQSHQIESLFDAAGNQQQLQYHAQKLMWNSRNQLQQVIRVNRDGNPDDVEKYHYDSTGRRVIKQQFTLTGGTLSQKKVVYLSGLELHTKKRGDEIKESLQVINVGVAGQAQVRVLHSETPPPHGIQNNSLRYSYDNSIGSSQLELDGDGNLISQEEYYPFGGTALWAARSTIEASYKTLRYSGKERDASGLYYYGYRYYQPWIGRWLNADPAGTIDGLNLYRMVRNNPVLLSDQNGLAPAVDINHKEGLQAFTGFANHVKGTLHIPFRDRTLDELAQPFYKEMADQHDEDLGKLFIEALEQQNESSRSIVTEYHKFAEQGDIMQAASPQQTAHMVGVTVNFLTDIHNGGEKTKGIRTDLEHKKRIKPALAATFTDQMVRDGLLLKKIVKCRNTLYATLESKGEIVQKFMAFSGDFNPLTYRFHNLNSEVHYIHGSERDENPAKLYPISTMGGEQPVSRSTDTETKLLEAVHHYIGMNPRDYTLNITSTLKPCHSCAAMLAKFSNDHRMKINMFYVDSK